jgi:hypothetical protein|nr:hypothetical protein Q903MT_gene4597 [Picea sitchensis]
MPSLLLKWPFPLLLMLDKLKLDQSEKMQLPGVLPLLLTLLLLMRRLLLGQRNPLLLVM